MAMIAMMVGVGVEVGVVLVSSSCQTMIAMMVVVGVEVGVALFSSSCQSP